MLKITLYLFLLYFIDDNVNFIIKLSDFFIYLLVNQECFVPKAFLINDNWSLFYPEYSTKILIIMKNLLIILAIFLQTTALFSQLYVSKNGSTDHYIYVKDEVLFVEDDIELNSISGNDAVIYLRDGSQLIQGSGLTNNSGNGYISIYQTINETSNYHWNFMHSPVGVPSSSNFGNQVAGVSRIFDVVDEKDSNPVSTTYSANGNSTTSPITISKRWIYTRTSSPNNEQEANYNYIGGNDGITPGLGFIMKGVSDGAVTQSQEYDFRGRPNNGTIDVFIGSGNQWTLTGNPYPSAIDLKDFYWDSDNSEISEILFWDEPKNSEYSHYYSDKSGGYGVYVGGEEGNDSDDGSYIPPPFKNYSANGGLGGNAGTGTGPDVDRRYSPVGQGFVVSTTSVGTGTVKLKNSHRIFKKIGEEGSEYRFVEIGDNTKTFTLDGGGSSPDPDVSNPQSELKPQIRFNVVMNDEYARQLLLLFSDTSTDGYDRGLDGRNPMDSSGNEAYFSLENEDDTYVIQTLPFEFSKQIPISFSLATQTKFMLETVELINCQDLFREAYLYDNVNNTYQKFTKNKSATKVLPAGVYEDRFFIVFEDLEERMVNSEGTKAIEEVRANVDFFQNNPYRQMEVSNPEQYNIKSALVYDMASKLVINKTNIGPERNFNISTSNLSDGVYLINLTTSENIDIDYKMIIQNK